MRKGDERVARVGLVAAVLLPMVSMQAPRADARYRGSFFLRNQLRFGRARLA